MSADFWEKLLLQAAGPLIGAIVGTLIIGLFVTRITRTAQERREDGQKREERARAEHDLRVQLIAKMTEAASGLYMATQHFWRKKDRERVPADQLAEHRKELDQQYRAARVLGEVIERQLEAYFAASEPRALWHATMDLLTVRYFQLADLATDKLLEANAGPDQSGLSIEELRRPELVLKAYHRKLSDAAQAVLHRPMRALQKPDSDLV